jgi:hypothetical protein
LYKYPLSQQYKEYHLSTLKRPTLCSLQTWALQYFYVPLKFGQPSRSIQTWALEYSKSDVFGIYYGPDTYNSDQMEHYFYISKLDQPKRSYVLMKLTLSNWTVCGFNL